jgi:hypothetical protein
VQKGRQRAGNLVKYARAALLLALDRLPPLADPAGRLGKRVAEHVRVAADQLLLQAGNHRPQVGRALFLEQQRQEHHLEEEVAELVGQLRRIERVRDDGGSGLLAIPRALRS